MADAKLAPNLPDWMLEHANRYLSSGGKEGHLYKMTQPGRPEITVPSLLLTTTGRKSGEKFIFPLFYGDTGKGSYIVVASTGGAPQHPGWCRNLLATPDDEAQVGTAKTRARGRAATGEPATTTDRNAARVPRAFERARQRVNADASLEPLPNQGAPHPPQRARAVEHGSDRAGDRDHRGDAGRLFARRRGHAFGRYPAPDDSGCRQQHGVPRRRAAHWRRSRGAARPGADRARLPRRPKRYRRSAEAILVGNSRRPRDRIRPAFAPGRDRHRADDHGDPDPDRRNHPVEDDAIAPRRKLAFDAGPHRQIADPRCASAERRRGHAGDDRARYRIRIPPRRPRRSRHADRHR